MTFDEKIQKLEQATQEMKKICESFKQNPSYQGKYAVERAIDKVEKLKLEVFK